MINTRFIVALAMTLLLTICAFSEDDHGGVLDYGDCGENLTWTLYNDGLLEISGTGAMEDVVANHKGGLSTWSGEQFAADFVDEINVIGPTTGKTYSIQWDWDENGKCVDLCCDDESGLGSAPIVAAAAQTRNPVRQALVSSTGTFWDTVVICALTGLVLVSSILAYPDITFDDGAALTKVAFSKIPYVGAPLLSFGILTFAFSTIIGWSYYGESAVNYLEGQITNRFYRILFIVALFFGSIINLDIIWNIADCMNALMAIPNLVALLLLSGVAAKETKKYLWEGRLDEDMEEIKD